MAAYASNPAEALRPSAAVTFGMPVAAMVALDVALIATNAWGIAMVERGSMVEVPYLLDVSTDFGLGERWNAIKWAVALGAVLAAFEVRRGLAVAVLAIVLGVMLADDYLRVHEQVATLLDAAATLPGVPDGLQRGAWGFVYTLGFGAAILSAMLLAALRAGPVLRGSMLSLFWLLVLLGGFGIFIDLFHAVAQGLSPEAVGTAVWGLVENGGEMLVITAIAVGTLRLSWRILRGSRGPG